jgi:tRNA-modifying protein YgfZ
MTGYEALHSAAAWIDISDRGKIRVTGEDRARLLHAMSTNDVQHLAEGQGLYAFFLTAVGRILADAYLYNLGDSLFLDTEPETATKLAEHLDKYIIADDATLDNETGQWAAIGIEGPGALDIAAQLGISVPERRYGVVYWQNGFVVHVAGTGPEGIRVFFPAAAKQSFVERLGQLGVVQASAAEARVVRMENGIPRYGDDISERYLVQETQQLHAVHFNKGCYLGQEIVERVRSRGQVHRVLMPLRIHATTPPAPGSKLVAGGENAAEITSAEFSPALGEVVGFAYVRTEPAHTKPQLMLADSNPSITAALV